MRRTVKALSLPLNPGKYAALVAITGAFAAQKNAFIEMLAPSRKCPVFGNLKDARYCRDSLLAQEFKSPFGLTTRYWRMALIDAWETTEKWLLATATNCKPSKGWTPEQRHYFNWLKCDAQRLARLMSGKADIAPKIGLSLTHRKAVQNTLRRQMRRLLGRIPTVQVARSFAIEPAMYRVHHKRETDYLALSSLESGKRIYIPLSGRPALPSGNVRIVLKEGRIEIHNALPVRVGPPHTGPEASIDGGTTEVFTDNDGTPYGSELGTLITKRANTLHIKGKARNHLHKRVEVLEAQGRHQKARNIRRCNLGEGSMKKARHRFEASTERVINTSINQLLEKRPAVVVGERLDIRNPAPSKALSRRCSLWMRGVLARRLEFKLFAGRSRFHQVNAAHSSQACPKCGYVDRNNRAGDAFQCLNCGHVDHADRVGAINLLARLTDTEITLYTPVREVKAILERRFAERGGQRVGDSCRKARATVAAGPELARLDMPGVPGANGHVEELVLSQAS